MKVTNSNPYGHLSDERLVRFEKQLGVTLPESYRRFLSEHNGGRWEHKQFNISKEQGDSVIHHVYGLHDGPVFLQLDQAYKDFRGRMPEWCVPVADDDGGNQVCIDIKGQNIGSVYFWDHETDAILFLSPTFEEFVESLVKSESRTDGVSKVLENDDMEGLIGLIRSGYDIEILDENDRSIIERAAIKRKPRLIEYLARMGADFRNSLEIAEKNAKYFEEHKSIVALIIKLKQMRS